MAEAGGGAAAARDEPGLLQHLEVAGDGRLRHAEGGGELGDGGVSLPQPRQDGATRRIGECPKDGIELLTGHM
jgi:hypothetical protein